MKIIQLSGCNSVGKSTAVRQYAEMHKAVEKTLVFGGKEFKYQQCDNDTVIIGRKQKNGKLKSLVMEAYI